MKRLAGLLVVALHKEAGRLLQRDVTAELDPGHNRGRSMRSTLEGFQLTCAKMEASRNRRIEGDLRYLYLGEMVMTRARRAKAVRC
jgi:hypothetical protein